MPIFYAMYLPIAIIAFHKKWNSANQLLFLYSLIQINNSYEITHYL